MSDTSHSERRRRHGRDRGPRRHGRPQGSRPPIAPNPSKPVKLTFWQKLLALIGLGPKPSTPSKGQTNDSRREKSPNRQKDSKKPLSGENQGKPKSNRPARSTTPPPAPDPSLIQGERLYVGNLSYSVTESDLFELFSGVGRVKNAEVVTNSKTHRSKGYGFVSMTTVDEARRAVVELHDKEFMSRKLVVNEAKSFGPHAEESSSSSPD